MLTKTNRVKCNVCGKWVSYDDLHDGKAINYMSVPETHLSRETYYSECRDCYKKPTA